MLPEISIGDLPESCRQVSFAGPQLAEEVVATIDNQAQLLRLLVKPGGAQDIEQACGILLDLAQ